MKILVTIPLSIVFYMSNSQMAIGDTNVVINDSDKIKAAKSVVLPSTAETSFSFENEALGKISEGWSKYFTGKGQLGLWRILDDRGNKVLAQTSKENFGYHFDVIVNDQLSYKDLEFSLKFKAVDGQEDQGGGPVWRFQDANNYYVARANPLENNFRLYKVVDGHRRMLKSLDLELTTGQWYRIKIMMKGNRIECFLNGKHQLSATDNTFQNGGKIGLWTKADAVTYFDDLKINGSNFATAH